MARPTLSFASTSIKTRMLHTSLPHRAPSTSARDSLSSLLSQTQAQAQAQAQSKSSQGQGQSPSAAVLEMLGSITSRSNEVDDGRQKFRAGNFTPPHSLTSSSLYPDQKPFARAPLLGPPRKIATKIDPFHLSKTSPTTHDLNPLFALSFVNQMGKIKGRAETGLTWKSQRKVGKLVRRARAMGLISPWSNQPVPGGLAAGGMSRFNRW
ncbi:ribosomal protein S18 [Kwoniella sp. CBS 6097]